MWILLEKVTDITSAEILAMDTVPVEIVPDPGDGKINVPVGICWDVLPGTIVYSGAGSVTTAFDGGATAFTTLAPGLNSATQKIGNALAPSGNAADATTRAGKITASLAAPLTSGNGTLRVTAKYYVQVLQS